MQAMQTMPQSETGMSRPLTDKEQMDISMLFNMQSIDFKDWSVQMESYVPNAKNSVDTTRDT